MLFQEYSRRLDWLEAIVNDLKSAADRPSVIMTLRQLHEKLSEAESMAAEGALHHIVCVTCEKLEAEVSSLKERLERMEAGHGR